MTASLGQPDWMTAPATKAVFDALEAAGGVDCARFVGGCVRNAIIGQPIADIDVATTLTPDAVTKALRTALKGSVVTSTLVAVSALAVPGLLVEIEVMGVVER